MRARRYVKRVTFPKFFASGPNFFHVHNLFSLL